MKKIQVRKVGHSLGITLPFKLCKSKGITDETIFAFKEIGDGIVLSPLKEQKFELTED